MKLQFIHKKENAPKASSLYCQWISSGQGEGGRLVAVWMDREMRAFEGEFVCGTRAEGQVAGVADHEARTLARPAIVPKRESAAGLGTRERS